MLDLKVETELMIFKSAAEIFEAIVDPEHMKNYFITSGSKRLDAGDHVTWNWADHGDAKLTIAPHDIKPNKVISFLWGATGSETTVTIQLEPLDEKQTKVKVCDAGVPNDQAGARKCLEQMQGWVHMLCCLKAYLEFGINLRVGKPSE